MTINELVSIGANGIGDGGLVLLNREEYVQFVNDTAYDLWYKSKAAHVVREYMLPELSNYYDLPDDDIVQFVTLQVRTKSAPQTTPEPSYYDETQTIKMEGEKPYLKNIQEGTGMWKNIGDTWVHTHITPELRDGRYRIYCPTNFGKDAVLAVHCVITSPRYVWMLAGDQFDPTRLDATGNPIPMDSLVQGDQERIWEPLRNLFIEGVTWRAARRASNFTKAQNHYRIWTDSEQRYKMHLSESVHFIHSLKDSTAQIQVKPFQYLNDFGPRRTH